VDEVLKERLVGYLDAIEGAVENGSAFVASEMPLVAWELVAYHRAVSTIYTVVLVCVFIFGVKATKAVWQWAKRENVGDESAAIFPGFITIVAFGFGVECSAYCLKAWFAPRLLILEEVSKLL